MNAKLRRRWLAALTALLAVMYAAVGLGWPRRTRSMIVSNGHAPTGPLLG